MLNEAYVKARYSEHYEISEEALLWLGERTAILRELIEMICKEHLERLQNATTAARGSGKLRLSSLTVLTAPLIRRFSSMGTGLHITC